MSTDLDLDELQTKWDILGRFQSHGPSRAVAERAWDAWLNASPGERDALDDRIRAAATYANHLFQTNAWYRDGDMTAWFGMEDLHLDELARRGMALRAQWQAQEIDPDDEEAWAREEAAEAEEERITRLEDEGAYGRTVRHTPDHARYIYIRFGRMPKDGYSHFGLAKEDTEDGPDPWRVETGGKWRENGICVFRAYHHPDHPGHFILMEPHFSLALYGVDSAERHLLAVVPEEGGPVLRVDGSPVTCKARDGTTRIELGSDGEYLIDHRTVAAVEEVDVDRIWYGRGSRLTDLLERRRNPLSWS
jgi:hypothetical protein